MSSRNRRPHYLRPVPRDTSGDDGTQYADLQIAEADPALSPRPRIQLVWPDDTVDTGLKYVELFDLVQSGQLDSYPNRRAFKRELARRAKLWAGRQIAGSIDDMNCKAFFREMAALGAVKVYEDGVDIIEGTPSLELVASAVLPPTILH